MSETDNQEELSTLVEFDDDLSNVPDELPLIPKGEYNAQVTGVKMKMSSNGNPYAEVAFRIPAEEYPADFEDGDPDGTVLVHRQFGLNSEKMQDKVRLKKFIVALGGTPGKNFDFQELVGCSGKVVVRHEAYEGEQYPSIGKVKAA